MRIPCNRNIDTFMYKKFPEILGKLLVSKVNNLPKEKLKYLNELLLEQFEIKDIKEVIKLFIENLKVNHQNNDYYITVDDVMVGDYKLESIISTIDYGNSKFPQFSLFNTSLLYVNNNLEALYKYSYLGVN